MIRLHHWLLFLALMVWTSSCGEVEPADGAAEECMFTSPVAAKLDPHTQDYSLNLSVFLDLSDRIDTGKYPDATMHYYQRDLGHMASIANGFALHCRSRKTRLLNERIQVHFDPPPSSNGINQLAQNMKLHLTKDNATKSMVCGLVEQYVGYGNAMYDLAIKEKEFPGSDIWGFFQTKVNSMCIRSGAVNRLIIFTDGYPYHAKNKREDGAKTSYLTPQLLSQQGLGSTDWKEHMNAKGYGLIPATTGLDSLEVLVVGVRRNVSSPYEGDVLKAYWENWLGSMGVTRRRIEFTDLPANLDETIQNFILGLD